MLSVFRLPTDHRDAGGGDAAAAAGGAAAAGDAGLAGAADGRRSGSLVRHQFSGWLV